MPVYNAGQAAIDIKPSLRDFVKDLRTDLQRIQVEYSIDVDADLTRFRQQIAALRDTTLNVDVDTGAAEARLAALARDRTVNIDVDDNGGLARTTRGAKDAERGLFRVSGVKFGPLTAAIAGLIPVLLGAVGAAGALGAAIGAIGATGLVGSGGMLGTFMAMKESSDSAGQAADDLAGKQEAAEKAARDVTDAQQDLIDAQKDAKKAQDDLALSYEEGRRALRDMNDALTDATLAQEDAEIALARAQERRNKVYRDRQSTGLDRAEADNNVRKAEQRLKEARSERADQAQDTARANAKGIAGSDPVVNAKAAKDDADQKVVDAQNRLADAMRNLTKAQADMAKGAGGVDKFNEALAKLAPSAQAFVLALKGLGPAWTDLRLSVQQPLFDGLGDSVTQFARQNLPGLKAGMVELAGYMNGAFKNTLTGLSAEFAQLSADGRMAGLRQAVASAMEGTPGLITGVTNSLITMADQVGPTIGPLLQSLGDVFKQMGPSLGIVGAALSEALTKLMPQFGSFINALSEGLAPVLPVLGRLLGALGDALQPLIPPLSQVLQTIGNALSEALPIVAPVLAQIVGLFGDMLSAVVPILPPLLQLAAAILTPLAGILRQVFQALAPVIQSIANSLTPVIAKITPVLAQVGTLIADALVEAIQTLAPFLPQMADLFGQMVVAMLPLLPPLVQVAADLLPMLVQIIAILMPFIIQLAEWFTKLAVQVLPIVVSYLQSAADRFSWCAEKVGEFATWVRERFGDIIGWVKDLPGQISRAASGMWDGIKNAFKAMLKWLFQQWNKIPFVKKIHIDADDPDKPRGVSGSFGDGGYTGNYGVDQIAGVVHGDEHVIKSSSRRSIEAHHPGALDYMNATGRLPGYADGGYVSPPDLQGKGKIQLGDISGPGMTTDIQRSMWDTVRRQFPDVVLFSATRTVQTEGHDDYHNVGKAIDISPTPAINDWIAQKYPDSLEMFFDPGKNIKNGQPTSPIGGHGDHIHWAYDRVLSPVKPIADPQNPNAGAPNQPYDPSQQDMQDGRDAPQKYQSQDQDEDRYPKTLSGWAGFAAKGFAEGYTKSTLETFGIPDDLPSRFFLTRGTDELDRQVRITDKDGRHIWGSYQGDNRPADQQPGTTTPPGVDQPAAPGTSSAKMPTNTPEGNIAAGTPGAKEAFWNEWGKRGWQDTGNWLDTLRLYNGESGWRADAQNPTSGAYGIAQFLGEDKKQRWPGYFTPDPKAQAGPAADYISERYKTPSGAWAFWQDPVKHGADPGLTSGSAGHWYDRGGWLMPGTTIARNETRQPEAVLTAQQWATAERAVAALPPQRSTPAMGGGVVGSDGAYYRDHVEYHISTARVEEAFLEAQSRADRQAAGVVSRWR